TAVEPEAVFTAWHDLLGHLACALAERTDLAALGHRRQGLDQLGQADRTGPPEDAGCHILGIVEDARQLPLAEVPDPDPAIQPEVSRSPHAAHEADDLLLDEQIVNDLWPAGTPV